MCIESVKPDPDNYDEIIDPMRLIKKNHKKLSKAMEKLQDIIDVNKKEDRNKSVKDIINDSINWKENDKYNFNDVSVLSDIN